MSIMVSGGFDPLHVGHLRLLIAAARYGPVVVALNSDAWLIRKKGYAFMPYDERSAILTALRCVSRVVSLKDDDGTVCEALARLRPEYFANGGDRETGEPRESAMCARLGITELFGVGGVKVQSSSELIRRIKA